MVGREYRQFIEYIPLGTSPQSKSAEIWPYFDRFRPPVAPRFDPGSRRMAAAYGRGPLGKKR